MADIVELEALRAGSYFWASLFDYLKDSDTVVHSSTFAMLRDLGDDQDGAPDDELLEYRESANRVWAILRERAELLGPCYPFTVSDVELTRTTPEIADSRRYLLLLFLNLAHLGRVESHPPLHEAFEGLVASYLQHLGFAAVRVGAGSPVRAGRSFLEAMEGALKEVGLSHRAGDAWVSQAAQDEGVDVLARVPLDGARRGQWTFIGQCTVGRSESWGAKLGTLKVGQWEKLLNVGVVPQAFLAVPHHIERAQFEYLSTGHGGVVLDRLRIARDAAPFSEAEERLMEQIDQLVVEW